MGMEVLYILLYTIKLTLIFYYKLGGGRKDPLSVDPELSLKQVEIEKDLEKRKNH
jgi:hypothetical protein